jgi:zinc transport system permease protein
MNTFFYALTHYSFLQYALIAGVLASISCGIAGTFVVLKRITFISGGIAHTVLGGVGLAYFLGINPYWGAFVAAILAAVVIGMVKLRADQHEDTVIGALWAVGMAAGIIFMHLKPGYNTDLMTYLFGNILLVSRQELFILSGLTLFITAVVVVLYRQFVAVCFDEEYARVQGLPVDALYLLLLILIALTIVVLIRIVGLILVIALLTMPAAIAGLFTRTPGPMMLWAIGIGLLVTTGGVALAYTPDLPVGATIIVLAGVLYLLSVLLRKALTSYQRNSGKIHLHPTARKKN